uniref:Uncharacterized protein n=1 Tax=Siphoviridae sp. ct7xv9 TaxID=2825355 RepID=A0A8S5PME3_9CAUD|nr:MAG TPA: Protein of unknown function (DUF658) [Siphoviridae sp. ct7xv9]
MPKPKTYALYKGDKLLGIGTAQELAELTGVSVSTIHYYNTPTYQRHTNPDRARRLIAI